MPTDFISFVWGAVFMFAFGVVVFILASFIVAKQYDKQAEAMFRAHERNRIDGNGSAEDAARRVG